MSDRAWSWARVVRERLVGEPGRLVEPSVGEVQCANRFADEIGQARQRRQQFRFAVDVVVVVVGEDVFGPVFCDAGGHRAGGLPGPVAGVGDLAGPCVQRGEVVRLIQLAACQRLPPSLPGTT